MPSDAASIEAAGRGTTQAVGFFRLVAAVAGKLERVGDERA